MARDSQWKQIAQFGEHIWFKDDGRQLHPAETMTVLGH